MSSYFHLSVAISLACASLRLLGGEEPVEGPPLLFARELVPEEMREGERFELAPIGHVVNFGYEFELASDFGRYRIRGIDMLETRIHEIEALDRLEEISKTRAFATSFSEALKNPVVRTWSVARKPITTVSRIPGGVLRYLQGKFFEVKRGSEKIAVKSREGQLLKENGELDEPKDKVTGTARKVGSTTRKLSRRYLGFDKAKRDWARRLKVDPYSTNDYLQFELERIAWASSVGSFAGEFAIPSSSVLSYALQAQEMVWSKSEVELERINAQKLKKMGVDTAVQLIFDELDLYTLTEKTEMVITLDKLEVDGRLELMQLLMEVESRDEALLMVKILSVFGNYNRHVSPFEKIEIRRGLAVARDEGGTLVLPLALDYLHWSPAITDALLSEDLGSDSRSLWICGTASAIAKRRLAEQNWRLEENCFDRFMKENTEQAL